MILDYDTKEDFYRDFVWLNAPISISEKFREESLSGDREESMFQFLVPKDWLINEFFEGNEDRFTAFMLDYTSEETSNIYSNALLNDKVLFEKRKEI